MNPITFLHKSAWCTTANCRVRLPHRVRSRHRPALITCPLFRKQTSFEGRGMVLSHEDVSGENDEAAQGKCRVDADHYFRDPGLEDTSGEDRDTDQCCQRNQ
jgi:hypothetical protein